LDDSYLLKYINLFNKPEMNKMVFLNLFHFLFTEILTIALAIKAIKNQGLS